MNDHYATLIEELTDIVAVIALAGITITQSDPSMTVVGAISTIAIGKRVIKK
jgi:hypothetical protein